MQKTFLGFFLAIATCAAVTARGADAFGERRVLRVNNKDRVYALYVPDTVKENPALVFSLHGAHGRIYHYYADVSTTDENGVETVTRQNVDDHESDYANVIIEKGGREPFGAEQADAAGCITVYPQGLSWLWGGVPAWHSGDGNDEDMAFLLAIIEDVAKTHAFDRKRIYCCGFSNGGMMTYHAASAAADVFAAFASISGFQLNEFHHRATGARPVPFLHIHGRNDGFVSHDLMPTIRDSMVARNGCAPVPVVTVDPVRSTKSVYEAGEGGFPFIYYEIDGMGHDASTTRTEPRGTGNSAKTMWNFMSQYTLDAPCDTTLKWRVNIDTPGWKPEEHGWTVNKSRTRFSYGCGKSSGDSNVYPSLPFDPGYYLLRFKAKGVFTHNRDGNKIYVKLETTDGTEIFCKRGRVWKDEVVIPFTIREAVECRITIVKENADDYFTEFAIHSCETPATVVNSSSEALPDYSQMIEIPQDQVDLNGWAPARAEKDEDGTTYTITGDDNNIAFKMTNIDVTGCDYVVIKFAEPVPSSAWQLAFWSGNNATGSLKGLTEYKFTLEPSMVKNGILPQCCLLTIFSKPSSPTIKVEGVYKHFIDDDPPKESGTLVKLPQDQSELGDPFPAAQKTCENGVITYTSNSNWGGAFKDLNIDVKDCDYVLIRFAEPVPYGWEAAVWGSTQMETLPEGATGFKYYLSSAMTAGEKLLPELTLLLFGHGERPIVAKVAGVYKHNLYDLPWRGFSIAVQ